jgi:two-component system, NtrC family, sensor histidine kinase HydH
MAESAPWHSEVPHMHDGAASTLELPEMLRRTTREIVRALNAHAGAAWHLSPTGDQLTPVAGYHIPKGVLRTALTATIPVTSADPLIRDAAKLRRPICSSDSAKDPRFQYPWARLLPHKSILVLPLTLPSTGQVVGGLAIMWTQEGHEFKPDEIRFAEAIAQQAGHAVENARRVSELRLRERQLATGVAHIFNNPLSVILGRAQLALRLRPNDPDLGRQLEAIEQAVLGTAETVRRLQVLAGVWSAPHLLILPAQLFADIRSSLQPMLKRAPATVIEIQDVETLPAIAGDLAELREALMNLVVNALEAMPTGGTIRVTAATEQDAIRILVEDTGPGMAPEVAARTFEPFFTTKGPGHAGLGLSLVSAVVERHSGTLTVETAEAQGATFTIRLPVWTDGPLKPLAARRT